jgi:hypothetical protein
VAEPGPAYIVFLNIIIYYNILKKNEKKIPIFFQKTLKKRVIFSNIFIPILHNIG